MNCHCNAAYFLCWVSFDLAYITYCTLVSWLYVCDVYCLHFSVNFMDTIFKFLYKCWIFQILCHIKKVQNY